MERLIPILLISFAALSGASAAEPALPAGLGGGASEPALPAGLGGGGVEASSFEDAAEPLVNLHGFADARAGFRTGSDAYADDRPLSEFRLQLSADQRWDAASVLVVADFVYDDVAPSHDVDLETGDGWIDLRQANVSFSPGSSVDIKAGRQILTWGTGDLLFINDNFPKDWQSFFSGRDEEYLKAPSDAVKASLFFDALNLDVVYTPRFDADRYISGERFSYFNQGLGRLAGDDAVVSADVPDDVFTDDEIAVRAYRNIGGYEVAAYGYRGFWKSPAGSSAEGLAIFPALSVYGASVRGAALGGIANLEAGRMVSEDDADGADPMVRNSELRLLAGYERDLGFIADDFTAGVQYYLEHMEDYSAYRTTLPDGATVRDEDRHVVTLRLTKLMLQQRMTLSLFVYYSPSDEDGYARPSVSYKSGDHWTIFAGGNVFTGERDDTFFGQFEDNSNVYAGARYSF